MVLTRTSKKWGDPIVVVVSSESETAIVWQFFALKHPDLQNTGCEYEVL